MKNSADFWKIISEEVARGIIQCLSRKNIEWRYLGHIVRGAEIPNIKFLTPYIMEVKILRSERRRTHKILWISFDDSAAAVAHPNV